MKGIISIDEKFLEEDDFHVAACNLFKFDYTWSFEVDLAKPFDIYLRENKKDLIERQIREACDLLAIQPTEEIQKLIDYLSINASRAQEMLASCKYLRFHIDESKVASYLDANPVLCDKFIVVTADAKNLTMEDIAHYEEVYGIHCNKLLISMKNNDELVPFDLCRRTVFTVENIAHTIEAHDFSPLEVVMYTYDFVRARNYNRESSTENSHISRDLSQVLFGDKIVCIGFANILDAILNRLGIASMIYILDDRKTAYYHARVAAFIEDQKYGVKGIYYFDPTWDCKEEDDEFLSSYRYFAKTKSEMEQMENGRFADLTFGTFSSQYLEELKKAFARDEVYAFPKSKKDDIDEISHLVDGKRIFRTDSMSHTKIIVKVKEYLDYIDSPLNMEIYLSLLFNVRKIQYYENPRRFPFSLEAFADIYYNSGWDNQSMNTLLLAVSSSYREDEFDDFVAKKELGKKIACIALTRLLKEHLESQKTLTLK